MDDFAAGSTVIEKRMEDSAAELAHIAIESLDVGVFIVDASDRRVLLRNGAAIAALAAFAGSNEVVPERLWTVVGPAIEAARLVPGRFTPAVPVTADMRRFFVRCRIVRAPLVVVTISAAELREDDIKRILAQQFGLSAQEIRVAFFAAQGYRNREIADRLNIVEGTVKNYLTRIFATLSVRSRTELATELNQLLDEQGDGRRG
jgi:DNA-binding CsgD family transcriptional regulator